MGTVIYEILMWHVPFVLFGAFCLFSMGFRLGQRCEILEEEKRAMARRKCQEFLSGIRENHD